MKTYWFFFIFFVSVKTFGQTQDSTFRISIKNEIGIEPKFKGTLSFEKIIQNKFSVYLVKVKYFGIEIYLNEKGNPKKIEFTSEEGFRKNKNFITLSTQVKKYIFRFCKWSPWYKGIRKVKTPVTKYYTIKDTL